MILLATLVACVLMVWALAVALLAKGKARRLYWLAGALLAATAAAWTAVVAGVSGSLWALLSQQGDARTEGILAGLGVAALSGVALLAACVPALVLVIVDTVALVRRLDTPPR